MHCAEQPARCSVVPGEPLQRTNTHTHTDAATWWHVINIVFLFFFCSGSYHGSVCQLLSLEQQMCGRHSRGNATWLTTLLIKTCRPASVCVRVCVCLCTYVFSVRVSMLPPPFPLVCTFGGCESESRQKMLFMKLVSFILDGGGGSRGLPQLEISKHRGK